MCQGIFLRGHNSAYAEDSGQGHYYYSHTQYLRNSGELQKYFPESLVTDGCIYIAAQVSTPGCIKMNVDIFRIIFGGRNKSEYRERLREIESDLRESRITGILSDNIARDALLKFSYVSPQGACGLYYNVSAGEIQKQGEIRDCFAGLVAEINKLALAMDIHFEAKLHSVCTICGSS